MIWFKILWAIDAVVAFAVLYFSLAGLGDNQLSAGNRMLWLLITGVIFTILYLAVWLKNKGQKILPILLLILVAAPALLYALFVLSTLSWSLRRS
jgi:hypothetical protein